MDVMVGAQERLPRGMYSKIGHYRRKVFIERLGWQLPLSDDGEYDQFDRPDTVYVIAQDHRNRILGCARLLPTVRPYLLADVFPQLLDGTPAPRSPEVWELSRFAAVDIDGQEPIKQQFSSPVAVRLLEEAIHSAAIRGAKQLITVSPLGVERLLQRAGFKAHRAGRPVLVGGQALFACIIEV